MSGRLVEPRVVAAAAAAVLVAMLAAILLAPAARDRSRPRSRGLPPGLLRAASPSGANTTSDARSGVHVPPPSAGPGPQAFPDTVDGAVEAATAWVPRALQAYAAGNGRRFVDAMATGRVRTLLARALGETSPLVHAGLTTPGASSYAARVWPLGYRIEQYAPSLARVRVWQLGELETDQPGQTVNYFENDTVTVRWVAGMWKFAGKQAHASLTPPPLGAAAAAVDAWVNGVRQFRSYRYVP